MLSKYKPNFFVTFAVTRLLLALVVAWLYGAQVAHAPTRGGHALEHTSR